MADTLIVRVEKAIRDKLNERFGIIIADDEPSLARAALAAAREPTETMLLNGWSCSGAKKKIQTLAAWQAMIDSALAEKP